MSLSICVGGLKGVRHGSAVSGVRHDRNSHLSLFITDPTVELFALQAEEIIPRLQDTTFSCYSTGSVEVVPSDHADRDSSTLAFFNGIWDLSRIKERVTRRKKHKKHYIRNTLISLMQCRYRLGYIITSIHYSVHLYAEAKKQRYVTCN